MQSVFSSLRKEKKNKRKEINLYHSNLFRLYTPAFILGGACGGSNFYS